MAKIKFPLRVVKAPPTGATLLVANDAELVAETYSASDDEVAELLRRLNAHDALVAALECAQAHLEWIGWGDSYERQCAHDAGLPEQIELALKGAQP